MADQQEPKKYNIILVGSGGVGTIASLVLYKSGRANVTSVLRSKYEYVSKHGWDIESVDHGSLKGWKPHRVVASIDDAAALQEEFDYVVVSTKQLPEQYSVADLIAPLVTPSKTAVLLIQNGIGIEDPLISAFPANTIMTGVSMIGSRTIGENGIQHVGAEHLVIGPHYHTGLPREDQERAAKEFQELYSAGGCKSCTVDLNMPKARWQKLLWNGTFNTLCALTGLDVGQLQSSGGRESLLVPMMWELISIAKAADGVEWDDAEGLVRKLAYGLPDDTPYRPSMLVDADQGRMMEVETILGAAVEKGRKAGIGAEKCGVVFELLKVMQWRNVQKGLGNVVSVQREGSKIDGGHLI